MWYLDTSVLVAALTIEAETRRVQAWLRSNAGETLVISDWVAAEFSAALSMKNRAGHLDPTLRERALAMFARMESDSLRHLPVLPAHFRAAARLADRHSTGLRAGDALHLAIAGAAQARLCTLDKKQAEAGPALGIGTALI